MKYSHFILISIVMVTAGCSSNPSAQTKKNEAPMEAMSETQDSTATDGVKFKSKGIQTIYGAYEKLRDALVATDFETAKTFAAELSEALKADESTIQQASFADGIMNAEEIEAARAVFSELNNSMESILEDAVESGEINKCFCPMALGNTGASWFTTGKEILNPYFGDKMLKCGSIKKTISN